MRSGSLRVALSAFCLLALHSSRQVHAADQAFPAADAIIAVVGGSMAQACAKLGPPSEVYPADPGQVCIDYGPYALLIEKRKHVTGCFFWPNWTQDVCGVHLSDSRDEMVKTLGKPQFDRQTAADNTEVMEWWNGKIKVVVQIKFKDQKCTRVMVKRPN
jgi:hypothetical protein